MSKTSISKTKHGEKLLRPIITKKITAWTYCELPVEIKVEVRSEHSWELDWIKEWVQVPASLIQKTRNDDKQVFVLEGTTRTETGNEIRFISFDYCKSQGIRGITSPQAFSRQLLDLHVSNEDLKKVEKNLSWLHSSSRAAKTCKRGDRKENERKLIEALRVIKKNNNHESKGLKKADGSFHLGKIHNLVIEELKGEETKGLGPDNVRKMLSQFNQDGTLETIFFPR